MAAGLFTQNLLASAAPWIAQDTTGDLTKFLTALGGMFDPVAGIVTDQGYPDDTTYVPGWSTLLDPDNCPTQFLPFLSQFNGTGVKPGTSDASARSIIKTEAGQSRGTPAALVAAAQRNLTGTQWCALIERTAASGAVDPYHVILNFHPTECPSVPALTAAVEAVKPAGIQISYVSTTGYTWNAATKQWSQETITWAQSQSTAP